MGVDAGDSQVFCFDAGKPTDRFAVWNGVGRGG